MTEVWYRYYDVQYAGALTEWGDPSGEKGPIKISCHEFSVIKHTPCGVRLDNEKFVNRSSLKQFACPTKELALISFIRRKGRQCRLYKARLYQAERALKIAKAGMLEKPVYSYQLIDEVFE